MTTTTSIDSIIELYTVHIKVTRDRRSWMVIYATDAAGMPPVIVANFDHYVTGRFGVAAWIENRGQCQDEHAALGENWRARFLADQFESFRAWREVQQTAGY